MSIDRYYGLRYDNRAYNCAHFACDVWRDLRGADIANVLRGFLGGHADRRACLSDLKAVRLLERPEDPCLIYFQAARRSHVGVWLRGRVLDIGPSGVRYQPLDVARVGFHKVRFFTC